MSIARAFNTTSIWILNIGSLKPLELPTEHFLSLAYDIDAWPLNSVNRFLEHWAAREFGEGVAVEVAHIMEKYSVSRYLYLTKSTFDHIGAKLIGGRCTPRGIRRNW